MNPEFKISNHKNWIVLHTKSRHEKKVADFCNLAEIINYLPLERRIKQYGKKRVVSRVPLFPGYLFCCCTEKERYNLLMTHLIARILPVVNQMALLHDLERLYRAQEADMDLTPCQHYNAGQRVKILSGPLAGYEGIIQKIKGRKRLVLNVDFIQRAAAVEVAPFQVAVLN